MAQEEAMVHEEVQAAEAQALEEAKAVEALAVHEDQTAQEEVLHLMAVDPDSMEAAEILEEANPREINLINLYSE